MTSAKYDPTRPDKRTYRDHEPAADEETELRWLWREFQERAFAKTPALERVSWQQAVLYNDYSFDFSAHVVIDELFEVEYGFGEDCPPDSDLIIWLNGYQDEPTVTQLNPGCLLLQLADGVRGADIFTGQLAMPVEEPHGSGDVYSTQRLIRAYYPHAYPAALATLDILLNLWDAQGYLYFVRLFGAGARVTVTRAGIIIADDPLLC